MEVYRFQLNNKGQGTKLPHCTEVQSSFLLALFLISSKEMGQLHNTHTHTHQQKMDTLAVHSTLTNARTYKHTTQAHMCMSCQKMGHIDKTHTTKRWDVAE